MQPGQPILSDNAKAVATEHQGLCFYGKVTTSTNANNCKIAGLSGYGDDFFVGYYIWCVRDAGGGSAAPQDEQEVVTDYTSTDGAFVHDAFTANLAVDDEVLLVHPALISGTAADTSGGLQMAATTIDLNHIAGAYTLLTGTTQAVVLEKLIFRMPDVDISGGALTSISIQTDDTTPAVVINSTDGALANLTKEATLAWTGAILIPVGTLIQLTIAGGASGIACSCNVIAESRAVVNLGYLA